ncbi:DnaA regulatory inactivator Hda [Thioalkalivibrio nitratireducens]|nr:DnaA regulatory inactivator Hda [Thioalkalivibrio nitratireducens]
MTYQQLPLDLRLRDSSRFETFHAGNNGLAVAAVQAVARAFPEAGTGERQVYLHGDAGSGKTHLLQAACHEAFSRGHRCGYLPLAEFAARDPAAVLEALDQLDLLVLDDLQAVAGQRGWERALFGLINRVRDRDGRLVLAARAGPDGIGCLLPDLVSRLAWGPVFRLEQPGEAGIRTILQQQAARRGLTLSTAVADYLLRHECRDLDRLLRLLDRLDLAALAAQRRLTIPFVRAELQRLSTAGGD